MLSTIWLALIVAFSLFCLSIHLKPLNGKRNPRALLAGIFGLAWAALHLRATYSILFASLPHPAIRSRFGIAISGGGWVTTLVSMGYRRGAKIMLIAAGILFFGSPLALALYLHWVAPKVALHTIFASPHFYILEAWPVGIAIPALILLWRSGSNDGEGVGDDGSPIDAGHTAENETGA
jgi:hypothetical protein